MMPQITPLTFTDSQQKVTKFNFDESYDLPSDGESYTPVYEHPSLPPLRSVSPQKPPAIKIPPLDQELKYKDSNISSSSFYGDGECSKCVEEHHSVKNSSHKSSDANSNWNILRKGDTLNEKDKYYISDDDLIHMLQLGLFPTETISSNQFKQIMGQETPNGKLIAEYVLRDLLPELDEKDEIQLSFHQTKDREFLTYRIKYLSDRICPHRKILVEILAVIYPPDFQIPWELCAAEYLYFLFDKPITKGVDDVYIIKFSPDKRGGIYYLSDQHYYNYFVEKRPEQWGNTFTDHLQIIDVTLPEKDIERSVKDLSDSFTGLLMSYNGKFMKQFWWSCFFKSPSLMKECLIKLYSLLGTNFDGSQNIFYNHIPDLIPLDVLETILEVINPKTFTTKDAKHSKDILKIYFYNEENQDNEEELETCCIH